MDENPPRSPTVDVPGEARGGGRARARLDAAEGAIATEAPDAIGPPHASDQVLGRATRTADEIDAAFRAARPEVSTPPTHFYLNLTETCNIRCRHCITRAPEKTSQGTGRSMTPEVLDALTPHLVHAAYVGLTHAGEPITAWALDPLLARLQAARRGAPTVVHVLTNGLALTEARFEALTHQGVSSWSFSIDGMSADTHDLVRIGSRIDRLTARIRRLSGLRRALGASVRMGIAFTLMSRNLAELPDLVRFAADAGLDWVKLEELVPLDATFEAEAIEDAASLAAALDQAIALGETLGLPVHDHTRSVSVWKCRLADDPEMARFSLLDDFANRVEINPCRFPYEVVCVEPSGDVKPLAFEYPSAGNLLEQDLMTLWNGPTFARARRLMRLRRLCGEGPTSCARGAPPSAW